MKKCAVEMSFNKHGHNNYKNNKKNERYSNSGGSNKLGATNSKHRTSTSCLLNWDDVKIGFKKFNIKRWNSIGSWVGFIVSFLLVLHCVQWRVSINWGPVKFLCFKLTLKKKIFEILFKRALNYSVNHWMIS